MVEDERFEQLRAERGTAKSAALLHCFLQRSCASEWVPTAAVVAEMLSVAQRSRGDAEGDAVVALKVLTNVSSSASSVHALTTEGFLPSLLAIIRESGTMLMSSEYCVLRLLTELTASRAPSV